MKVEDFFPFFGDCDLNDQFDDRLQELKIKARPRGDEVTVSIRTSDGKTIFVFESLDEFQESRVMPPKSDGQFLLCTIEVHPGSILDLPFGLRWEMNGEAVRAVLGEPTKTRPKLDGFYKAHDYVMCRYTTPEKEALESISFGLVDVYAKERYNL